MTKILNSLIVFMIAFIFIAAGPEIERKLLPVKTNFTVLDAYTEGNDLIVTTSSVKHRSCKFIGTRAKTADGVHLQLKRLSNVEPQTWVADDDVQISVPWRVVGGAGETIQFYQEFECHPLWHTFVELGTYVPETKL